MKNVLFIVYYFPPMGGSGVQRPLKFAKYLREFGWNPIVLCPEPGVYHTFDKSLEQDLESLNLEIHRVQDGDIFQKSASSKKSIELDFSDKTAKKLRRISRLFFYPDNKRGWISPAYEKGLEIVANKKIDLIFSTAPPFSNHLLGQQLKETTGIPLVVDYRDSWTRNHFQEDMWSWQKQILRNQERRVVATADKIICLDEFIKNDFVEDYPELENRLEVIPHGFDSEDFNESDLHSKFQYKKGALNFLYSGLFYEQNQPDSFLESMYQLFSTKPALKEKVHLHFQGTVDKRIKSLIENLGLSENVTDYGYLPHRIAAKNLLDADVLWMISNFHPELKQIKSGKLFEYFGSRKPIMALVHESEASKLLEAYEAGFWANPLSVIEIKNRLELLIELWEANILPKPNNEFVAQFERKSLTQKLVKIFNVISS